MARLPDWDEDMVSGSLCLHCPQVVPMALAAASAAVIRVQGNLHWNSADSLIQG